MVRDSAGTLTSKLEVSEIFGGGTFQGEGPFLGRQVVFLRLHRCNLQCSWCDTKYTWSKDDPGFYNFETLSVDEVRTRLLSQATPSTEGLVISGGEPLMWRRQLAELVRSLPVRWSVEVETNGTIPPKELRDTGRVHFNVSPKLGSSGAINQTLQRLKTLPLREFADLGKNGQAVFKFVVTPESWESDFEEIREAQRTYGLTPIYVMPEGISPTRIVEGLAFLGDKVIAEGWRMTPRLHVLIWGNKRGV